MKTYIFQNSQIIGSIVKQIPAATVLDQNNLTNREYNDILSSNADLLNKPLDKVYNLIKVQHPILGKKTKNDLYYLASGYENYEYLLISDDEPKTLLKYNLGDIYHKDVIGAYYIFNVEYRFDGVYYWICYPGLIKSNANRRIHESKMKEYNVDFDKAYLDKNILVQDSKTKDNYVIQSIDKENFDWTIKNVVLKSSSISAEQKKLSKEALLINYDFISLNEALNDLKEIDVSFF